MENNSEERLDLACRVAGGLVTLGWFLYEYVLKPAAFILCIVFVLLVSVSIFAVPVIFFLLWQGEQGVVNVVVGGYVIGMLLLLMFVLLGVFIWDGVKTQWYRHGAAFAERCQRRKRRGN